VKAVMDKNGKNVASAIGFSTRENKIYSFKAKAMLCATAGAVNCFRPRSVGEGMGRTWYPVFCAGSGYAFGMQAGDVLAADLVIAEEDQETLGCRRLFFFAGEGEEEQE